MGNVVRSGLVLVLACLLSVGPAGRPPAWTPVGVTQPAGGTAAPGAGYAWPLLPPPAVLTPFRPPTHAYGPGHRGVDLAGRAGQPVLAARAGTVVFAGPVAGHGVVSVQHDDGLRTTYEPVSPAVAAGAVVRAGDVLGRLDPGHAGCPGEAACLHWGVRRDRLDYLDPLVLLSPVRVRLLPVPDPWPDGDPPAADPAWRVLKNSGRSERRPGGVRARRTIGPIPLLYRTDRPTPRGRRLGVAQ